MSNSAGNTKRDVMRFLRESGVPPTVANVERIGREIRRTHAQNEQVDRIHKEIEATRGVPSTVDEKGDVHARVRKIVEANHRKRR